MIKRGVLWAGFNTVCLAHTEADVAHVLEAYRASLEILNDALVSNALRTTLRGEPVEPVFRRTSNFNVKPKAASRG